MIFYLQTLRRKKKSFPILENISVETIAAEGKCIARWEGRVIFIDGREVVPQDVVDLQITAQKKNYWEGRPIHFQHLRALRQTPFCKHFGVCGGCKWQHLSYESQLYYKQLQVEDNLRTIGKTNLPAIQPIMAAPSTTFYRNKLEFTFSNQRWLEKSDINKEDIEIKGLGFHIPRRFDKILDIEECHLQKDPSNEIRMALKEYVLSKGYVFFDPKQQKGFLRNLLIRTTQNDTLMVAVIFGENNLEAIESILEFLRVRFPMVTSLQYSINTKMNDSYYDLDFIAYRSDDFILEQIGGMREVDSSLAFKIRAKSFFQTNSMQAYHLYKAAIEMANLKESDLVYDLYCGAGTISLSMARSVKKVVGLEYVEVAVEDARENARINVISNAHFFAGDIRELLSNEFINENGYPDVIMTDPPRAGMHPDVLATILTLDVPRIVYISCNPATQARDVQILSQKYEVAVVQPVDMFPQTHHVENIILLTKRA